MWDQIDLKGRQSGQFYTTCPACSHTRRKKKATCLSVNIDEGVYKCHHCGASGSRKAAVQGAVHNPHRLPEKENLYLHRPLLDTIEPANGLFAAIANKYGHDTTLQAFKRYHVATEGQKVVFHYLDHIGIRYARTFYYDSTAHRTATFTPEQCNNQKHETKRAKFRPCLFGQHLARELPKGQAVQIVESEKTALICSLQWPQQVWMATGGSNRIDLARNVSKARLHPDSDQKSHESWKAFAERNSHRFTVDETLQKIDVPKNTDLADILLG